MTKCVVCEKNFNFNKVSEIAGFAVSHVGCCSSDCYLKHIVKEDEIENGGF